MISPFVRSAVRMHLKDRWGWFYLPWIILMSSFLINVLIAGLVPPEEGGISTGGIASIFIYFFVAGVLSPSQTFPFALGFSMRRKDYYSGTALAMLLVALAFSFLLMILSQLETATDGWFVSLHFFSLPYFSDGNVLTRIWINLMLFIFMFYMGFAISSIHRRFGRNGLYLFFLVLLLGFTALSFMATYYAWWTDMFHWLSDYSMLGLATWLLIPSVICSAFAYGMLRRATV